MRLTEIALRWCQHHSVLTPEDGIIIGASSKEQLEQNCVDSAKGPLPDDVVKALDEACRLVRCMAVPLPIGVDIRLNKEGTYASYGRAVVNKL